MNNLKKTSMGAENKISVHGLNFYMHTIIHSYILRLFV